MASNLEPEGFVGWLVVGLPSCVMVQAVRKWGHRAHCRVGVVSTCVMQGPQACAALCGLQAQTRCTTTELNIPSLLCIQQVATLDPCAA